MTRALIRQKEQLMSHSQPPFGGQNPYGQQPQPGYPPPPPQQQPKRKRRTGRVVLLCIIGAAVIIILATALSGHGQSSSPSAGGTPAATSAASATPAATTAAAPPPAPRVLLRIAGNGIENSAPFSVGSGALTVHYSFNCSSFGSAGNFQADLLYGDQSSLGSDDQPVANALAMSGSQTTTVYPQDPGKDYYLSVNSECSWKVRVSS
jgi:hypothetical protein